MTISRRLSRRQLVLAAGTSGLGLGAASLLGCRSQEALAEPPKRTSPSATQLPSELGRGREIRQVVVAEPTTEGAGVRLRRALGSRALSMLDPFLMLDEFHSDRPEDYQKGFPSHPHRGFETVTYMLEGAMEHRDSMGNHGRLGPGTAQWMTAGHGIIHSEMPKQERGLMWGFQLWVNLPAASKLIKPRYQDVPADRITDLSVQDARIRLVAGELAGRKGPVADIATAPLMFDVTLPRGGRFAQTLPSPHNAFVYVFEGASRFGTANSSVQQGELAVLGPGDHLSATSNDGARFLVFAGRPIGEPVARYGPFVMNTDEEIRQAMEDYRAGRLVDG